MDQKRDRGQVYVCPMWHANVRQPDPGKCPRCGMDLVPEGGWQTLGRRRFAMVHWNPKMLMIVLAAMLVMWAAVTMMMRYHPPFAVWVSDHVRPKKTSVTAPGRDR